jgi:hypothetical protein
LIRLNLALASASSLSTGITLLAASYNTQKSLFVNKSKFYVGVVSFSKSVLQTNKFKLNFQANPDNRFRILKINIQN